MVYYNGFSVLGGVFCIKDFFLFEGINFLRVIEVILCYFFFRIEKKNLKFSFDSVFVILDENCFELKFCVFR